MKGKRSLKKQQKRQVSALAEIEELYRRQPSDRTDDEILARAAEIPDLAASPFAGKWAEVAGRALRQSLAGGDLDRLERLLGSFRRSGRPRAVASLATLAEAVLDLAAGRFEAARSRLAELPEDFPALRNLARDDWNDRSDDPPLQAARELFQALQTVDVEALAKGFRALRNDSAESCLSLLTSLTALEGDLKSDNPPSRAVVSWLQGSSASLTAALTAPPQLAARFLAPLRHAVHMRWRAVLQGVARREGSPGLAILYAAAPKLLAQDVEVPRGMQGNLAAVRQRAEAQQLISGNRYGKLAELLRSRSRTVSDTSTLAALWSLELWTYRRQALEALEKEEADESFGWPFANPFGDPSPTHKALVRLQEMAGEIRQRFPAAQRAEVAGVLRAELFDLCEQIHFCEHTAGAALSLLEHLPSDLGLLIAGVAGAVNGEDRRALSAVQSRIARTGKAREGDRAVVHRLMTQVAKEDAWTIAAALDALRPLFADGAWQEITALVAREMAGMLAADLREEGREAMDAADPLEPDCLRPDLDVLRPALAGTLGFAAIEMALGCWLPDRRAAKKRLDKFLADVPGLEGPLVAFRFLEGASGPWAPQGAGAASRALAAAIIDRIERLGASWQLWCADVPALAFAADSSHLQRLEETIRQLLASPEIQQEGRGELQHAHRAVQKIAELQRLASLPEPRRRARRPARQAKKKTGRASQLKLDLP